MIERLKISLIGIVVWWILLLPFDYALFNWFFKAVQFPFKAALQSADDTLLFETDTYGCYLLISLSITLGIVSGFGISWCCKKFRITSIDLLKTILASILFFFLMKYGWNKVTKSQFYTPEPNTLYTPLGKLSKDIAYWSLMGSSYSYTLFLGIFEMLVALLLIFKRTQFLASLLAVVVFGQIVLVNISFDISVKLLSGSLLGFSLLYSACFKENWKAVFGFSNRIILSRNTKRHQLFKYGFVLLVAIECVFPAIVSGNWNDDHFPRLKHHGAYQVEGSETVRRVYIHRQGFLVLEDWKGNFLDYKLKTQHSDRYEAADAPISCVWKEKVFQLIEEQDTFGMKPIAYKELPLLKSNFHWFSDEFH